MIVLRDRIVSTRLVWLALALSASAQGAEHSVRYAETIASLNAAAPESTCQARATLRAWIPDANASDRAAMFRSFREFYLRSVMATDAALYKALGPSSGEIVGWFGESGSFEAVRKRIQGNPELLKTVAPWLDCGFALSEGEGMIDVDMDPATLLEFANSLPDDLAGFVRFEAAERGQEVAGDATLMISLDQLGDRLARWEESERRYPDLPETKAEVVAEVHRLAWFAFLGIDNTRVYDRETFRVRPEVIAFWSRQAERYPDSKYRPLAEELVRRMQAGDGRFRAEDRALFERFGFGSEFEVFWRDYDYRMRNPPR